MESPENKTPSSIDTENNPTQPRVYFRGVNRIHINRFKAYCHIISNRLNANWMVTDDITAANIVVVMEQSKNGGLNTMQMSVLAGTANLKPKVLKTLKLIFDDRKLVQQLNHASKILKHANKDQRQIDDAKKVIKVCGLLNESLNLLCDLLNQKSPVTQFEPSVGVISSSGELYRDQLLLIVDGQIKESIAAFKTLINKKRDASIIIDQLTVAIIKSKDDSLNERLFDQIYAYADDDTQVTLLNTADEHELDSFVTFF